MKYNKLKKLIISKYKSMYRFCKIVNLSQSSLSYIFSGKRDLTWQNMKNFGEALSIPHDQYYEYFFRED